MSVYSISMYVWSELASIGARVRQLETDARKRRNIDCVQDLCVCVLFATFVPNKKKKRIKKPAERPRNMTGKGWLRDSKPMKVLINLGRY